MAVVAQEKRWTFAGYGVAKGDQVKWVNNSAISDDHCNWHAEEIDTDASNSTTSATANVTFVESSEATGPLQLCYRFSTGNHPFKLYPAITVSVFELHGVVAAEEGSTSASVVGYSKRLVFSGFGAAELDEAKWLLQGSADCSSAEFIAPLASGGDSGTNAAVLSSSYQTSFEFTEEVFLANSPGTASANATLCYKFGSEEFQRYPTILMSIYHLTGWISTIGEPSVAVVGVSEDLTFTGHGISEDVTAGDRARWIMSGTDCEENAAPISNASDGRVNVSSAQASFVFMPSTSGETPRLCYWFQSEPAQLYASLTISVAYVSTLSAPSFGDADVAVVGYPKTWGFAGGHIGNGDFVRWIYNESLNCSDLTSVVEMEEIGEITSGETTCTFAESSSGHWITPCYRYGLRGERAFIHVASRGGCRR